MVEFVGKCLYVESLNGKRILAVGDLHLGYEESLNFSGVFVSRQLFKEIIGDLEEIFRVLEKEEKKVDEVVLLGDVRHEFGRLGRQERSDSDKLFDFFEKRGVRVVIARGNHDTIIEPLARARGIEIVDVYRVDEIAFVHGNKDWKELHEKNVKMWVVGHGHPAVVVSDGVKRERFKCFLEGTFERKRVILVPSFIAHSPGTDPRDHGLGLAWNFKLENFNVHVVSDGTSVFSFGKLKDLN